MEYLINSHCFHKRPVTSPSFQKPACQRRIAHRHHVVISIRSCRENHTLAREIWCEMLQVSV